jgi:hypothetical protein
MLSTDHPIPREEHPVDHVFATTTLTDKQNVANSGRQCAAPARNEGSLMATNGPDAAAQQSWPELQASVTPTLPDAWRVSRASKASTLLSLRICLQPIWPRFENRPTAVNCIPADRRFSR